MHSSICEISLETLNATMEHTVMHQKRKRKHVEKIFTLQNWVKIIVFI